MSILADYEINTAIAVGNLKISPFSQENVQPNSYDVSLGDTIISNGIKYQLPYTVKHGEFILATTKEKIELKRCLCAQVDGKSTTARKGLMVHLTAGFIDCGFRGNITLEMVNFGKDFVLEEGMKIGQLIFFESSTPMKPYNGHYQDQYGVTPAYDEWENGERPNLQEQMRDIRDKMLGAVRETPSEEKKPSQNPSMKRRGRKPSTKV